MLTYDKIQVRRAWAEALRSGEYRQTCGELLNYEDSGPCYCCLGVLCALRDPFDFRSWGGEQMPPSSIMFAAEIGTASVNILARLNDAEGWSFDDIARYIEEGGC